MEEEELNVTFLSPRAILRLIASSYLRHLTRSHSEVTRLSQKPRFYFFILTIKVEFDSNKARV